MEWNGRKAAAVSAAATAACLSLFDIFVKPIIDLNVENWATRHGLGDLSAAVPPLPSARPLVSAGWEVGSAIYGFFASGYGLAFAAGCLFIAFFDSLTWLFRVLRDFWRSGGLFGPVGWDFRGFLGMV